MKTKFTSLPAATTCVALLCIMAGTLTAANLVVTNTADSGPGTLREALAGAANGETIDASGVSGTIILTSGELSVPKSVILLGPGPATLMVSGNHASRVFNVTGTNVTLGGLTIAHGAGGNNGMGINAGGSSGSVITLSDCVITNNSTSFNGGGIYNHPGVALTLSNCTISANDAAVAGGGIYNDHGAITIVNSTLNGNSAGSTYFGPGGGIYNDGSYGSANLTINASTLSSNSSDDGGGGICNDGTSGNAAVTVNASTFNNNSAPGDYGGAIYNDAYPSGTASVTVNSSTFTGNSASGGGGIDNGFMGYATLKVNACTFSGNAANLGGAIFNYNSSGKTVTLEVGDTIFNEADSINNSLGTVTSRGYNLASDDGGLVLTAATDRTYINPKLGPLQDNGGPTLTHALLAGSPAIDKGKANAVPGMVSSTDQRGLPRPVDFASIANASGGDGSDIGAFEGQYLTIAVTSTADSGGGTLRGALASAADGDLIDATGVSGTIILTSGELAASKSVTILGPGPGALTVSGNGASRVFNVTGTNVTLGGLTIANGYETTDGAGIRVVGGPGTALTISNCVISNNSTVANGGGIYSSNVALTIIASLLRGNSAFQVGGGIMNDGHAGATATLKLCASTLSSNSAWTGGGLCNYGPSGSATSIINACTFSGNFAGGGGGNIQNSSAAVEIGDTILNAGISGGNIFCYNATVVSHGYNLCSDNGSGYLTDISDQINTDPKLGPLQDNGGPSWTHALLPGSPAIDAGDDSIVALMPTDQRGLPRLFGAHVDIGAYESQLPNVTLPLLTSLSHSSEGTLQFNFTNAPGELFTVLTTTNLALPTSSWTVLSNAVIESPAGFYQFTDTSATNDPQRYYRVRWP